MGNSRLKTISALSYIDVISYHFISKVDVWVIIGREIRNSLHFEDTLYKINVHSEANLHWRMDHWGSKWTRHPLPGQEINIWESFGARHIAASWGMVTVNDTDLFYMLVFFTNYKLTIGLIPYCGICKMWMVRQSQKIFACFFLPYNFKVKKPSYFYGYITPKKLQEISELSCIKNIYLHWRIIPS